MKYPHEIITELSKAVLAQGIKILQGNRLADTEAGHVDGLALFMKLNGERRVADMGCGFGEVSRLLAKKLPGAVFYLVNQNGYQLSQCPSGDMFKWYLEDMCETSIPDASIDHVMFNYSLCHVDLFCALAEAARVATDQGKLFVYDYERVTGNNERSETILYARFPTDKEFRDACAATGWRQVKTIRVDGDDALFRRLMNNDALYDEIFDDLQPVIWKARR